MTSEQSFVDYICEQIAAAGVIGQRKMFGEYALYCDAKVVAMVCDNQLFIKDTSAGRALLPHVATGSPYPGAKPWLVADEWLDNDELIAKLIRVTAAALPAPKPKASGKAKKKAPSKKVVASR